MPALRATLSPLQVLVSKDESVAGRVVEHVKGLEAEVNVLKHLDHPNIVRYLVRACIVVRAVLLHVCYEALLAAMALIAVARK